MMKSPPTLLSRLLVIATTIPCAWSGTTEPYPCPCSNTIQRQKILASDGWVTDNFGGSMSVSGDSLAVGAQHDSDHGGASGSCYLFRRQVGQWVQEAKLTPPDGQASDFFGSSVAVADGILVVGAKGDDDAGAEAGSVYVYEHISGTWTQVAKLLPLDVGPGDEFGAAVAVSGARIIVGVKNDTDNGPFSGSTYVFERVVGVWSQTARLFPSLASAQAKFGSSVAVDGSTLVVGASGEFDHGVGGAGAIYFFEESAGVWSQVARLNDTNGRSLGNSLSLDGSVTVTGAPGDDEFGPGAGSAHVFEKVFGSWTLTAKITAHDAEESNGFGSSVSVVGTTLVVGAHDDDENGNKSGSGYVFRLQDGRWDQVAKIVPDDGMSLALFGLSTAIVGDTALFGAPLDDGTMPLSGSVYSFDTTPAIPAYGQGCQGSGAEIPTLCVNGVPAPGATVTVEILNAVGGGTAWFFLGTQPASTLLPNGCTLNVAPLVLPPLGPFILFPIGGSGPGNGWMSFPAILPVTALPGTMTLQAFILDGGAPGGFSNTNAVSLDIL